jgi:transcriptional regulator with XRE-family HTH domain
MEVGWMSAALRKMLEETTAELNRVQRLVTLEAAVQAVVAQHGGVRAAERATGVDKSFISRLMNGHKVAPSAETLEALGLRAVPLYEVLKRPNVNYETPPVR